VCVLPRRPCRRPLAVAKSLKTNPIDKMARMPPPAPLQSVDSTLPIDPVADAIDADETIAEWRKSKAYGLLTLEFVNGEVKFVNENRKKRAKAAR
jgi:hypothetical protein